jgi:two-component system response regulator LytT
MIRISLIDDDSQDITRLRGCLERYDKEHSIGFSYTLFDNAQKFLATDMSETDLLILDIDMPGLNGIEAAKLVRKTNALLPIVFVTNLFQYAIQGYQVNAIDYIVKPVEYESLSLKIERILEIVRSLSSKKATVSTDKGTRVIDLNQIIYIEVRGHYLTYHLEGGETLETRGNISGVEKELRPNGFSLCNRYYLVNLRYVTGIQKSDVETKAGSLVMSKAKKKTFANDLTKYLGGYR